MTENQPPTEVKPLSKRALRERQQTARRVYIDSSSPSVRSIVRIVVITMIILFVAGSLQSIISSLAYLTFLLFLSIFFAYLIDPLVRVIRQPFKDRNLEKLMPRSAAILIAYVFVFTVLAIGISNIAPRVVEQAKEFGQNLPVYGQSFHDRADELTQKYQGLRIPEEAQAEIKKKITDMGSEITTWVGNFVLNSVTFLPWLILIPILAFFFLKDVNLFRLAILRSFPAGRWRSRAEAVVGDVNKTLAAYTRAQLISCLLIGTLCTLGFWVIGLKYALFLGILAGTFEFVPLLGPLIVGTIVVLTALFSDDPWKGLYVGIFLVVLRILQDYVFYPRIVREGIHLHPLMIILSVLAGEQVAGIPGVFISIPIVAVASVIYRHIIEHRGGGGLFAGFIQEERVEIEHQ